MRAVLRRLVPLVLATGLLAEAPIQQQAEQSFAVAGLRNTNVRSYTSKIQVDFALRSFPYLKFHLVGHVRWQRPDDYSVSFEHVPWFGKGFEHMKADALEPSTWHDHYDVTGLTHTGDRTLVEMRDKIAGNIKGVHAELDADGLRRIVWQYVNGGKIDVAIQPRVVDGVPLPAAEDAEIKLPAYHVVAHAVFTEYNVVSDR